MNPKGYCNIPGTLFECITFIARALPVRSVPTYTTGHQERVDRLACAIATKM